MGVGDGSGDTGVVLTPPPPHDRRAAAVASVKAAGESHTTIDRKGTSKLRLPQNGECAGDVIEK
jgi:hypothetical protein